jgi:hypothetical protein
MTYLIGCLLALATAVTVAWIGLDRRTFYTTLVMVVAHYYVLFAVMGGSSRALLIETGVMSVFIAVGAVGFRKNLWIVALALAGHGAFDLIHGQLVTNAGVPVWWPGFCASYDIAAAIALAWLSRRSVMLPMDRKTLEAQRA